ncbi:unnamed protein product [Coregonus sp. 'balchen']|nr:unnamed protein product [Coregonus sp. 'balchen']
MFGVLCQQRGDLRLCGGAIHVAVLPLSLPPPYPPLLFLLFLRLLQRASQLPLSSLPTCRPASLSPCSPTQQPHSTPRPLPLPPPLPLPDPCPCPCLPPAPA